jgi:hypothetical protein
MPRNLLKNEGFEADWGEEKSHRCLVFPKGQEMYEKDVGNIFTPPGWVTWFRHDPGTWDQPEVRDAWKNVDPHRVHSGEKGMLLFTFFRKHDAGFLQQVDVVPGSRIRVSAWAHAWSNHTLDGYRWSWHKGRVSSGVGEDATFILEGEAPELNGDPWNDAIQNFTFYVGIDPTGGMNPLAETVMWGRGAHIYNEYAQVPAVEAVAKGNRVTVFLRSKTMWGFNHNDAYWDDAEARVVEGAEPEPEVKPKPKPEPEPTPEPGPGPTSRGEPREQYERAYVLLPPGADAAMALAVVDASWNQHRYTIGGSADDAGIGDLDSRRVIAVNPGEWPDDLEAFFAEHYPGAEYVPIEAETPAELRRKLERL